MNLVFLESAELEKAKSFFPKENFVQGRIIGSESDLNALKQLITKNTGSKFCAILSSADSKLLQKIRSMNLMVAVIGKNISLCMWAVQQKCDWLLQPFGLEKPALDLGVLQVANQNQVKIGLFFSELLFAKQSDRARWLANAFTIANWCKKTRVPLEFFCAARSLEECRCENDLRYWVELAGAIV